MLKSMKIFSIVLILFAIFISFYGVAFASDVNMNLLPNETANETVNDENAIADENTLIDDTQIQEPIDDIDTDAITPPSNVGATTEEGLGLTNILSILLITVGVILILLSIAIIIRLK